ncbi:hypothetical protein L7F22_042302 [Adiantum nelumboides]|nr:hypothetical protein [Adiantum nelumboides]
MADQRSVGSQEGLVNRRGGSITSSRDQDDQRNMYQPGQPIGYLAARGTPYERKYFTRKLGVCCLFLAPPILLIVGAIALVPVLYAIADHALHTSVFHVYGSNITNPQNGSFPLTLNAQVKKVGIFPASIHFREPIDVYWNTPKPDMREVHLGRFNLARVNAAAGHGTVNQATFFTIADQDAFSIFAGYLISQEEFTWRIKSKNLHVEAFSFFPTYKSLSITKNIIIKGINNFGTVEILDLQLPGADPEGGIAVITTTNLVNPSPFGIQVGTLDLDLFYKGHYLGPVSVDGLNITAGPNIVTLRGRVLPYPNNQTALDILGDLFTNYINSVPSDVVATGKRVQQENGDIVKWLSDGVGQLNAHVNFVPPKPIDPIKGITIETINLEYSQDLPYNPILSSQNLKGVFQLPFGFPLNITQLATQLSIAMGGANIGSATGPFADSNTIINVLSEGQTAGDIDLQLPASQLILPNSTDAAKKQLIAFQNAFVYTDGTGFDISGAAKAVTDTPVGKILLNGIKFNVATGLKGLAGLTRYPTIINSVDVTGGTKEAVDLNVALTVVNPSNLNLSTGDVKLQLLNQVPLGITTLPNLKLLPGRNDINATATFDPNVSPYGLETLNRFISGLDTKLNASGFGASSQIVSLEPVLEGLRLNTTLPALQRTLVQAANLTVLDTTGIENDIANSIVQLANPFTSPLEITRIAANASAKGIFLANINTGLQFNAAGKATSPSPNVPLSLNLYPPDLFSVLREYAIDSGQNPAYVDGIVQLGGFTLTPPAVQRNSKRSIEDDAQYYSEDDSFTFGDDNAAVDAQLSAMSNPGIYYDVADQEDEGISLEDEERATKRAYPLATAGMKKRDNLYTGFNLETYVGKAFSVAKADLQIVSDATIGDYGTTLTFSQSQVPLGTDQTLFKLLPVLAKPIVQRIVDGAILNIDRVTITEARPTGFTAQLQGALTNAGPFDGIVTFPEGLSIYWQNQLLTQTAFPNITLVGDLGSSLNVQLEGNIPDVDYFTKFLASAITDPSFVWDIRGTGISVSAIGINVPGISLTKSVQLTGLNGLKGQVIINSFDLPSNDPAGGIHLTAISTINNPAQVGVALSSFGVDISMGSTDVGPSAAAVPFTLQALAVTEVPLAGRIQRQDSEQGLADLSTIFTRFVHNQNTDLVVQGVSAGPPDVAWLNNGIKALRVTVALPAQDFQVIRLISLNQLSLFFTVPTAWNPQTDSSNTTANFFLPFAFPVDITQVAGPFTANYNNQDMAVLNIPTSPTTTDVEARILTLAFSNVPFAVFGNAHQTFSQFAADFVARQQVTFNLHGTTDAKLNTAAGQLSITQIPFNLNTNLLGLQGLNAKPAVVSNLDVYHGYPTYLQINVDTALFNPSDTTVGAGDVSFAVEFMSHIIGSAMIKNILLPPGDISVPTEIQYMPIGADNVAAGQVLLENYIQNITSTAIVLGTSQTTPIESLKQALAQIQLTTQIPALNQLLVQRTFLTVPKNIAQNGGIASVTVTINNPFTAGIHLLELHAAANFQDITVGRIDQNLAATNNIVNAPGHQISTSQPIPFNIDIRPKNLLRFILAAAQAYGVSLGPLPPFFQEVLDLPGEAETQVSPYPDDSPPPCSGGNPFDTLGAIKKLVAPLAVSIPIQSVTKLDDYQTNLDFIQQPVPVGTDDSILYLVGPAAAPLIQLIVDQATLETDRANATSLTNEGFTVAIQGKLLTNAPADAYIEAPDGLLVSFQGQDIATLAIPPLCTNVPDGIPNLQITAQLTILPGKTDAFADFAYYLLTEPNFQWTLHSDTVTVRTLGIKFSKVNLSKVIQLDAFNGLPGIVITSFETNGDGNKQILITTGVAIPSQAALGVELGQATFDLMFQKTNIGRASSSGLFLAYKTTTNAVLKGYLGDQSNNPQGLADLGVLFTQYLAGENSTLTIRGYDVIGPASGGQPINWLTTAFKRFSTQVILPGHIYQIIFAITLSDLEVYLINQSQDFHVPATNQHTTATFANPLVFSLSVVNLKPSITITYKDVDTASLLLPTIEANSATSHNPNEKVDLSFGFTNQTINSLNDPSFASFFGALTDTASATFGLKGSTDVLAQTVIGRIPIQHIPFNVTTSLAGINSFNHKIDLVSSSVDDPIPAYLGVHLNTSLENPSNLTVHSNQISLPTFYQGTANTNIGRAYIPILNLVPGTNAIPVLFELMVINNNSDTQEVIRRYVSPTDISTGNGAKKDTIPLKIDGGGNPGVTDPAPLSPYGSLNTGLAGVTADTALQGIGSLVISEVRVYLGPSVIASLLGQVLGGLLLGNKTNTAIPAYADAYVDFNNDLPSGLLFKEIYTNIFSAGTNDQYATFTNVYNGFSDGNAANSGTIVINPKTPKTTGRIKDILLQKGVVGSLPLIGKSLKLENVIQLDLFKAGDQSSQYFVPGLKYNQDQVCTKYFITAEPDPKDDNGVLELGDSCGGGGLGGFPAALLNDVGQLLGLLNSLGFGGKLGSILNPILDGANAGGLPGLIGGVSQSLQNTLCNPGPGGINLGTFLGGAACSVSSSSTSSMSSTSSSSSPGATLPAIVTSVTGNLPTTVSTPGTSPSATGNGSGTASTNGSSSTATTTP